MGGFYDALSATVLAGNETGNLPREAERLDAELSLFELYCWKRDMRVDPMSDDGVEALNKVSVERLRALHALPPPTLRSMGYRSWADNRSMSIEPGLTTAERDRTDMLQNKRCVPCPDCTECGSDPDGRSLADWRTIGGPVNITLKQGYSVVTPTAEISQMAGRIDILQCPSEESCISFNVLAPPTARHRLWCARGHDEHSALCAICSESFVRDPQDRSCSNCGAVSLSGAVSMCLLTVVVVLGAVGSYCSHQQQVGLWVAILRLAWPRFKQSLAIIVTNFQILANVGESTGVTFPAFFASFTNAISTVVNLDIFGLPGLSCLLGGSYYRKFISKMLMPVILVMVAKFACRLHLQRIRTKRMPIPADLSPSVTYKMKLNRSIVTGNLVSSYSSLLFAIVYLLYPSTSKAVFVMFRCRLVAPALSLLDDDYSIQCWTGAHLCFCFIGAFCLALYPVGIPLYLGRTMWARQDQIQANPKYIDIAHYRPLFQFYKADCFMFEIYFMLEKVVLIGVVGECLILCIVDLHIFDILPT
jgi:hypothetical protein